MKVYTWCYQRWRSKLKYLSLRYEKYFCYLWKNICPFINEHMLFLRDGNKLNETLSSKVTLKLNFLWDMSNKSLKLNVKNQKNSRIKPLNSSTYLIYFTSHPLHLNQQHLHSLQSSPFPSFMLDSSPQHTTWLDFDFGRHSYGANSTLYVK